MTLLHRVDRFLKRSGMSPTPFGRLAVRDPRFVSDLRRGRTVHPRLEARVDAFIAAQDREAGR